ncbi:hypothetical protein L914_01582 [Phytophthora nicotianae]|uniref:Uncharacterized protein n=3 Tax=Phytophthora nicotianae TaxID=4792 RepID=V9FY04_PHYNI|nr:hypothetical protein F443_01672 [Phytophthora nicotianae P1569]ETL48858.1 hypothetical protein L916_01569 [Phytophthora nicotianae]ETM55160.1 hypothetical protein L914_01582 [Phytophthora nicotianae]ETO84398.1 hypothetical protein F444_01674 [Phytophthora nicotianae P1976]
MARRRRRAMLAFGTLAAAAAHCVALSDRRLITFDEAHNAVTDTITEVANEAVDTANTIVSNLASTVLGGATRTDETSSPSTSISVTIGGNTDDIAEKPTTTGSVDELDASLNDENDSPTAIADSETTTAPTRVTVTTAPSTRVSATTAPSTRVSVTTPVTGSEEKEDATSAPLAPIATRRSGVAHAVYMTKQPTPPPSSDDETGAESTADSETESAAPTAAPAPRTQAPTDAPVTISIGTQPPLVATEAPVPVSTPVPVSIPVSTDIPVPMEPTTAPVTVTQAPEPAPVVDTATPSTHSSSVADTPDRGVIDDETDAPAVTGSTSTDAAVIVPDESTVVPITDAPAMGTGSAPSTGTAPSPESPASWTDSSGSSSNNETVTIHSASGSEDNSEGISPGQVHASSSADVSLDGSDALDIESSNSPGGKPKKNKKKETHSSSGDYSADSTTSEQDESSKKSNSGASNSGMDGLLKPGGVSDVNTSAATYYSLGTGSIVAIVGVIAGIMGLLVMFVAISRKKYADDDDESPLPYGYDMDMRSISRLSPTFMQDDSFMESGYNGTALMVAVPPPTYDGASSISGESADEVPSLRGNMMAANHCDPLGDISIRSRVPSMQSFSGELDTGNVRVSALYSAGSSMTSGSEISGSWSSVLASDTDRQPSRNTRDTTLSGWSATNLSSFGSTASGASGLSRMTRSSSAFSALSTELRHTGGSDRSRSSSRLTNHSDAPRVAAGPVDSSRSDKSTEI